jgi:hypothetical protein
MEVMVPELRICPTLLSGGDISQIAWPPESPPMHPDAPARPDGYWAAYIVKGSKTTAARIDIQLTATHPASTWRGCSTPSGWMFTG